MDGGEQFATRGIDAPQSREIDAHLRARRRCDDLLPADRKFLDPGARQVALQRQHQLAINPVCRDPEHENHLSFPRRWHRRDFDIATAATIVPGVRGTPDQSITSTTSGTCGLRADGYKRKCQRMARWHVGTPPTGWHLSPARYVLDSWGSHLTRKSAPSIGRASAAGSRSVLAIRECYEER